MTPFRGTPSRMRRSLKRRLPASPLRRWSCHQRGKTQAGSEAISHDIELYYALCTYSTSFCKKAFQANLSFNPFNMLVSRNMVEPSPLSYQVTSITRRCMRGRVCAVAATNPRAARTWRQTMNRATRRTTIMTVSTTCPSPALPPPWLL